MAHAAGQAQQLKRIPIAAGIPGVLDVVAADGHRHTGPLQLSHRCERPLGQVVIAAAAQQPEVGGGQRHHLHGASGQAIGQALLGRQWHQAHAAGMAAGDRHLRARALQLLQQQLHTHTRRFAAFIHVQIDAAAQGIGQLQHPLKCLAILARPWIRRPQHAS